MYDALLIFVSVAAVFSLCIIISFAVVFIYYVARDITDRRTSNRH